MNKKIKIKIPDNPRALSEAEENHIADFKFRNKTYKRASKQAKQYIAILVSIIESNKPDKGGFVHIPTKYLGRIFKSDQMADYVLDCALQGIIVTDNHYNADKGVSKGYKIKDSFKYSNVFAQLKNKKTEPEPMKEEPEPTTEEPSSDDLNKIGAIVRKYNTPFYHKRIEAIGIDPFKDCKCSDCENEMPAYMFSISKGNKLNTKCRICWELEPVENINDNSEAERVMNNVLKMINKPTITQRSIEKLKAKYNHPDYVPTFTDCSWFAEYRKK